MVIMNSKNLRLFKLVIFLSIVSSISVLVVFNLVVDPLQFYKKADKPLFVKNQRIQIPGLLKNYDYDTLFIGTSLSENFSADRWYKKTGNTALNVTISGSSVTEQIAVIKKAIQEDKVKSIVWELNYRSFGGARPNLISNAEFPHFLYEEHFLNTPLNYLLSFDTLILSLKNLFGLGNDNLDQLNSWWGEHQQKFDGKFVVKHYCSVKDQRQQKSWTVQEYTEILSSIKNDILHSNPELRFVLFIPPMSYLNFEIEREFESFNNFLAALKIELGGIKNVQFVNFVERDTWISDLTNYKDIEHYNLEISDEMQDELSRVLEGPLNNGIDSLSAIENRRFQKVNCNNFE